VVVVMLGLMDDLSGELLVYSLISGSKVDQIVVVLLRSGSRVDDPYLMLMILC
jgi:hypothetical protein